MKLRHDLLAGHEALVSVRHPIITTDREVHVVTHTHRLHGSGQLSLQTLTLVRLTHRSTEGGTSLTVGTPQSKVYFNHFFIYQSFINLLYILYTNHKVHVYEYLTTYLLKF